MRVSQAKGQHLDRLVAAAMGKPFTTTGWAPVMVPYQTENVRGWEEFNPSSKWEQGGPLITEGGITIRCLGRDWWAATPFVELGTRSPITTWGKTPLEAAMRCFVQTRLGENVNLRDLPKGVEDE